MPIEYYQELIEDPDIDIYIAINDAGKIIGFVSIHRKKYNIVKVRDVIGKLSFENKKTDEFMNLDDKKDILARHIRKTDCFYCQDFLTEHPNFFESDNLK